MGGIYRVSSKTLDELTFKDNFMFGATMMDPEICKGVIECALGIKIEHVEVDKEKCFIYNPNYHGVRFDIYADSGGSERYDVEMQIARKEVPLRARYYHSQMDEDALDKGADYRHLPRSYVIFICDYDPFGDMKYRYTVKKILRESGREYDDRQYTVILSTVGTNDEDEPKELVQFLRYVRDGTVVADSESEDDLVNLIRHRIDEIKISRDMRGRYMTLKQWVKEEYEEDFAEAADKAYSEGHTEGHAEGHIEGESLVLNLINALHADGRDIEIQKVTQNPNYREKLYEEYGLK